MTFLTSNVFAKYSSATIQLQGVVPRIVNKYVLDNKIIIEHNFPIEKPEGCVIINNMKMICDGNVTIVSTE